MVHTLEGPELLAELAKEVERPHRRLSGAAFTEAEALLAAARAAGFAPDVSRDRIDGDPPMRRPRAGSRSGPSKRS